MNDLTEALFKQIGDSLDGALVRRARFGGVLATNDIPSAVAHFDLLRDHVRALAEKVTAIQKHVDLLSQETIPTLFTNQNVKTITIPGVGRTSINVRWSATMLNRERAFAWLRSNDSGGMIIETVNAQTLGAFAKERILEGKPLPTDTFKVGSSNYVSITKG